jgi:hypothetical protein
MSEQRNINGEILIRQIQDELRSRGSPEVKAREAAWAEESERRIDAFDAGRLKARDAQSVFSDLRRNLQK